MVLVVRVRVLPPHSRRRRQGLPRRRRLPGRRRIALPFHPTFHSRFDWGARFRQHLREHFCRLQRRRPTVQDDIPGSWFVPGALRGDGAARERDQDPSREAAPQEAREPGGVVSDSLREVIVVPDVPHEFDGHPAKIHQDLARVLIENYSNPGDIVLDPFAGIGTIPRIAKNLGRDGVGIELEEKFVSRANEIGVDLIKGSARDSGSLMEGRLVDLVLTSPPYGEAIGRSGDRDPAKTARAKADYEKKRFGRVLSRHSVYGVHPENLGSLPFRRRSADCFEAAMPGVVSEILSVLRPGGIAAWVVKDQRWGRKRLGSIDLFAFFREASERAGCVYVGRRVAVLPDRLITQWQRVNASRWGIPIPNAEHVVVVRKPGRAPSPRRSGR